jgi:mRNA interferase MazF
LGNGNAATADTLNFISFTEFNFMSLRFYPRMGTVLVCDFSAFVKPEMTKVRPVVVVSPKLPYRSEIVAVVPLSTTAPRRELPYCYRLQTNYHPDEPDDKPCWAKADMVVNIAPARLEGFKIGRRRWIYPQMTEEDLTGVRLAIACGLGLDRLLNLRSSPVI